MSRSRFESPYLGVSATVRDLVIVVVFSSNKSGAVHKIDGELILVVVFDD